MLINSSLNKDGIIRIFHLSDIHFGKFNYFPRNKKSGNRPFGTPDGLVNLLVTSEEDKKPHFMVISGDLTSVGSSHDYIEFLEFINKIINNNCLREVNSSDYLPKDRIIIVPGNHDVARTKIGNDKLSAFNRYIVKNGFNTPFSRMISPKFLLAKGDYKIPNSVYYYPDFNLSFHCIISCYYSESIPDEFKEAQKLFLKAKKRKNEKSFYKDAREILNKLIRNDFGILDADYLHTITKTDTDVNNKTKDSIKFCVMHHNVNSCDSCPTSTVGADVLRENLFRFGYKAILHGHIHQILDHLPTYKDLTVAYSCGSLSGNTSTGLSFNIIDINQRTGEHVISRMDAMGNNNFSWSNMKNIYR